MRTTCFLTPTSVLNCGQYNGYIGIDKETYSKYINVDYDDFPDSFPQPHGGVTYFTGNEKRLGNSPIIAVDETFDPKLEDYVILGFDTCHINDTYDKWDFHNTRRELLRWRDEVIDWINKVSATK